MGERTRFSAGSRDISKDSEGAYLLKFAGDDFLDDDFFADQLRALWTAYCLHNDLDIESEKYEAYLKVLWAKVAEKHNRTAHWSDYGSFAQFARKCLRKVSLWDDHDLAANKVIKLFAEVPRVGKLFYHHVYLFYDEPQIFSCLA